MLDWTGLLYIVKSLYILSLLFECNDGFSFKVQRSPIIFSIDARCICINILYIQYTQKHYYRIASTLNEPRKIVRISTYTVPYLESVTDTKIKEC